MRCVDANSTRPSTVDLAARQATIEWEPGETVTCTFANHLVPAALEVVGEPALGQRLFVRLVHLKQEQGI